MYRGVSSQVSVIPAGVVCVCAESLLVFSAGVCYHCWCCLQVFVIIAGVMYRCLLPLLVLCAGVGDWQLFLASNQLQQRAVCILLGSRHHLCILQHHADRLPLGIYQPLHQSNGQSKRHLQSKRSQPGQRKNKSRTTKR